MALNDSSLARVQLVLAFLISVFVQFPELRDGPFRVLHLTNYVLLEGLADTRLRELLGPPQSSRNRRL